MAGNPRFDWTELRAAIRGEVFVPGAAGYDEARRPALARFHGARPQAVVRPTTAADVAATIGFARRHGLRTSARSGGHCFAGRSSIGAVVVDVTSMGSVSVSDGVATVGAGARLGELDETLDLHGRAIPAGCGRSVGIAGLALGGGLGILGRKYGLTCDQLLSARVVLADGRVVECDADHHGDLFWALRGAGGGHLGVVTSLVFATVPAPVSTSFHLVWSPEHAAAVIDAWQAWAPTAPDDLDATLRLTVRGDERSPVINLLGAMHGSEADTELLLGHFIAGVGAHPSATFHRSMPYREVKQRLSGLGSIETGPDQPQRMQFSRSEFFRRPLPRPAVAAVLDNFAAELRSGQSRELDFTPWGGAYNRMPSDATAFVHREERFMIEHVVTVEPTASSADLRSARAWLGRSWASVHPWGSGRVYPNFPDPDLADWAEAYYGTNYDRLLAVKRAYDPDDWFRFPQSLGSFETTEAPRPNARAQSAPGTVEKGTDMTDDTTSDNREPDAALRALDRLVGTWVISGDATGVIRYRWMDGGFFLAQEGELELYGHRNSFTEIIGRERPFGAEPSADIKSRTYTAEGDTLDYVYELAGDTLTIWGGQRGSDAYYIGTFSADCDILSGQWTWPGGGYATTSTRQAGGTQSPGQEA